MKYIKIYESFVQMNPSTLGKVKSMIESAMKSTVKLPIYLEGDQETPGLVKFISEMVGENLMDMMVINLDQLSLAELEDSFPKESPMDKGGILFIEGMEEARPENKKMLFDKIADGTIPAVWQIVVKGPSTVNDKEIVDNFTRVKLN
jgi:hypothetical protein